MDAIYDGDFSCPRKSTDFYFVFGWIITKKIYTKKRSLLIIMKHNEKEKRERIKNDKKNVYIYKGDGKRVPLYRGTKYAKDIYSTLTQESRAKIMFTRLSINPYYHNQRGLYQKRKRRTLSPIFPTTYHLIPRSPRSCPISYRSAIHIEKEEVF